MFSLRIKVVSLILLQAQQTMKTVFNIIIYLFIYQELFIKSVKIKWQSHGTEGFTERSRTYTT